MIQIFISLPGVYKLVNEFLKLFKCLLGRNQNLAKEIVIISSFLTMLFTLLVKQLISSFLTMLFTLLVKLNK